MIDAVEAEALQALLVRTHDAVVGIVVDETHLRRLHEEQAVHLFLRARKEQAPDLGPDREIPAPAFREEPADAHLGEPEAVQRRGVEVADALVQRGMDKAHGRGLVAAPFEAAAAEAQSAGQQIGGGPVHGVASRPSWSASRAVSAMAVNVGLA